MVHRREGVRRRQITAWAARRAHVVLAPSAFSGREIVRYTGVPEARVRVVHLGVREPATVSAERRPSVLFVGSLFQRRHIDVLIDAFARVAAAHPEAHLDIVGENRTVPRVDYTAQVAALGLGARVGVRHWVDDEALTHVVCASDGLRVPVGVPRASASRRSKRWRTGPCR